MGQKDRIYADVMAIHPEVTGSCHQVVAKLPNKETIKFIVDCGMFQEREYSELNYKLEFKAEELDFVLVTHNHVDHTGRLPFIVKKGFYKEIYATKATTKLLPYALRDSYKVHKCISKRKNRKCLFNEDDVDKTLLLLKPCEYNETLKVRENVSVTFLMNGHLPGAALILVQISYPGYEDINLLFTGDYNNKNMFFDVEPIPKWIQDLNLTIIQESTYGNMDSFENAKCFKTNVSECVLKGGTVLAPVFSLGRSQEILYELKCMQDKGKLCTEVPIFLDGTLAIEYTRLYIKCDLGIKEEMKDFLPKNLNFVDKANRNEVFKKDKTIVLTTSGMGSYGPAQTYIPEFITRENVLIHFTGYTAEGTLGHRLKYANVNESVEVGGLMVKKRARVEYTTEYSAHAKADEMIEFLKQFKNLKLVLVNHGQEQTKLKFAKRILDEVQPKNVGILGRDYFFRVNPYGLVKTLSTKFK